MPTPTPFSVDQYCRNAAYPAVLEVRLTTTPIPTTDQHNLSLYNEAAFPGYQRFTGPRSTIFKNPIVGTIGAFLESKALTWVATASAGVSITAALVIATFPGEDPQIINVVPINKTIGGQGDGFTLTVAVTNMTQTP